MALSILLGAMYQIPWLAETQQTVSLTPTVKGSDSDTDPIPAPETLRN